MIIPLFTVFHSYQLVWLTVVLFVTIYKWMNKVYRWLSPQLGIIHLYISIYLNGDNQLFFFKSPTRLIWDILGYLYRWSSSQVFNKLISVPSWASAWEADKALHQKVQTLHEVSCGAAGPAGLAGLGWE